MKKMIVTFINGQVIEVPMKSRRSFNLTKKAMQECQELVELEDYCFKLDQVQCISFIED